MNPKFEKKKSEVTIFDQMFADIFKNAEELDETQRKIIQETIRVCKEQNILTEYLTEHEQEVTDILMQQHHQESVLKACDMHDEEE